jgi:type II secretory pathway pseudopilin PulG
MTLLEVLVVGTCLLLFLCFFVLPNLVGCPDHGRSKVSRVKADLRSMATAVEAYFVDHSAYPAWSDNPAINGFQTVTRRLDEVRGQPTFRDDYAWGGPESIRAPTAYVTSHFTDPFAPAKGATFCYTTGGAFGAGWIMWSAGPDGDYDLTMGNVHALYDPATKVPSDGLVELTYDPTNGATSGGDVYRLRE